MSQKEPVMSELQNCLHGFNSACLICGFSHIEGNKVWFDWAYKHQQVKVDGLKSQLKHAGYTDNGGELMKPPIGKPPRFDLLGELKNSISEMAQKYRIEAHELGRIRDFEKSQMCSHFANELENLNKGGA